MIFQHDFMLPASGILKTGDSMNIYMYIFKYVYSFASILFAYIFTYLYTN